MEKRGFEFSFAWLFALLVGSVIIFLAIFATMNLIKINRKATDTFSAKQLTIVFEPMEVGLAEGKSSYADLDSETRIYNICYDDGGFGDQEISISTKSGLGKEWENPGVPISIKNKYIFSSKIEQGKRVYFFSKPFKMPFKVSEMIFLTTNKYCFINAPEIVREDISGLNLKNIKLENCSESDINVCFGGQGKDCKILVSGTCLSDCESNFDYGYVTKDNEEIFYTGNLIYSAIFSDNEVYECNVKRLVKRLIQQSLLYLDEANYLSAKCGTGSSGLSQIVKTGASFKNSKDLILIKNIAKEIEYQNDLAQCGLW